jgi:2-(1,2-epoxy-1,2-dihydrophenyl)acetyl-CoA isomerase
VSADRVLLSVEDGVGWLTLNRPDAGNAIDIPMAHALLQAAIRCDQHPAIRCVVLTGAGKMFCVGGDVAAMGAAEAAKTGGAADFLSELAGLFHMGWVRLMQMQKPLITVVNGAAAGAGFSMAIGGDVVLAAKSAHFTSAYTAVGLSTDGGLSWMLPRLVGLRKAQEMILRNLRVGAEEAQAIGLITRAVDDAELEAEGRKAAAELANAATPALGAARALLLDGYATPFEAHLEREVRRMAACAATPQSREGVAAFLARRKPDFRGAN